MAGGVTRSVIVIGAIWGFARVIWGYLGIWRGLSRAIWGFGVDYLGLFFPLPGNFLGNRDDLGLFGDMAWVI